MRLGLVEFASLINLYRCYCNEWELFPVGQARAHMVSGRVMS